jgi:hypothetical protein
VRRGGAARPAAQPGLSVAIRTTRRRVSGSVLGRPRRRLGYVHFRAISWRCPRRMVSAVTIVATCASSRRPRAAPRQPSAVGEPQTLVPQLRLQHAVLFAHVLDDLMLVPLKPTNESGDENSCNGVTRRVYVTSSAILDTTRSSTKPMDMMETAPVVAPDEVLTGRYAGASCIQKRGPSRRLRTSPNS